MADRSLTDAMKDAEPVMLELGRLVTAAASVENLMDIIIGWLLTAKHPMGSEIVCSSLDFRRKTDVMVALITEQRPVSPHLLEIAAIIKEIHGLYDKRNELIHGIWRVDRKSGGQILERTTAKSGKLRISMRTIDASEIRSVSARFLDCANRIQTAISREIMS